MCGHRVPGVGHRHRAGGPGVPGRFAPLHWSTAPAHRQVGPLTGCDPQGTPVPPHAGRAGGVRCPGYGNTRRQSGHLDGPSLARGRPGPAGGRGLRRRGVGRGGALPSLQEGLPLPRPAQGEIRPGARRSIPGVCPAPGEGRRPPSSGQGERPYQGTPGERE